MGSMTVISIFFAIFDALCTTVCFMVPLLVIPSKKDVSRVIKVVVWIGYAGLMILIPSIWRNDFITIPVLLVYYLLMGWFMYHHSRIAIFYQLVYFMGFVASQIIAIFLLIRISDIVTLNVSFYPYFLALLKGILLICLTLMFRVLMKKRSVGDTKQARIGGMILVPLFSIALIFIYLLTGEVFFMRFGYEWILIDCLILIIINAYCLYFWYDVVKNREFKHKLEMMEQQNELSNQYYEEMERSYNESRKIIHDIRNHLNVLEQTKQLQDEEYFKDLHSLLNSLGLKYYSENRILNIVLNDKLKVYSEEQVECNLGGIDLSFLADIDITTIFTNLLDNAEQASKGQAQFFLSIRGEQIHDFIILKFQNPYAGEYCFGKSTKEGHEGIGLQNVKHAIEPYHGEMTIECRDQMFIVTIVFMRGDEK